MDGRAWWAAVYGVAQSRARLKQLSSSSSKENVLAVVRKVDSPCWVRTESGRGVERTPSPGRARLSPPPPPQEPRDPTQPAVAITTPAPVPHGGLALLKESGPRACQLQSLEPGPLI